MSTAVTVILIVIAAAAILILSYLWLTRDLGRHGGKDRDRDEETAELFAKMNRPAEIASETAWWEKEQQDRPQEMAAVLLAAAPIAPGDLPAYWLARDRGENPPFPWRQEDGSAETAVGAITPPPAAALAEAQAAPFRRWESDTFVSGIPVELDEDGLVKPAFDAELVRAAERAAAETAAGAS